MQKSLLSAALLSIFIAGCSSSSSSPENTNPQNDGQDSGNPTNPGTGDNPTNPGTGGDPTNPDTGSDPTIPNTSSDPTKPVIGGDITGNFIKYGSINISEDILDNESEISGRFNKLSSPVSAADILAGIKTIRDDVCEVSTLSLSGDFDQDFDILDLPNIQFESISAGDIITLSSAAGSFGELKLKNEFDFDYYESEDELPFPIPTVLTIDIPGAEFPAYSNVQVPAPESLTGFNIGVSDSVDANMNFTWNAASSTNTILTLDMSIFNIGTSQVVSVDCNLTDDGQFKLPSGTVAELNSALGAGWTFVGAELERSLAIVKQQGDSILVITREIE